MAPHRERSQLRPGAGPRVERLDLVVRKLLTAALAAQHNEPAAYHRHGGPRTRRRDVNCRGQRRPGVSREVEYVNLRHRQLERLARGGRTPAAAGCIDLVVDDGGMEVIASTWRVRQLAPLAGLWVERVHPRHVAVAVPVRDAGDDDDLAVV